MERGSTVMITFGIKVQLSKKDRRLIEALVANTERIAEEIMAFKESMNEMVTRLNTATNTVAAEVRELKGKIEELMSNPGNLSELEQTEILAGLDAVADRLEGLGADPSDPIPAVEGEGQTEEE